MSNTQAEEEISLDNLVRCGQLIDEPTKCRILGESVSKSRRDRLFGKGVPHIRLGRQIRFDPRDIASYIAAHRCGRRVEAV